MQTYDGADVYPGLEEKAAHLLYFLVKNHSFVDGAKRIADNALVAITLMIAESAPEQRQILTHIIVELINDRN